MSIGYNDLRVTVFPDRIAKNLSLLCDKGRNCIPVIKSDAYGHGLAAVAKALVRARIRAGAPALTLAVGTVGEAVELRGLPFSGGVVSLLGPQDLPGGAAKAEARAVWEHRIMPFVYRFDQLEALAASAPQKADRPLAIALKFDTGMARLGFTEADIPALLSRLAELPTLKPVMLASHLATADMPEAADFVREQAERFAAIAARLAQGGLSLVRCLANSAAILAYPDLRFEAQRPGIALYGANPFSGTALSALGQGLVPAMQASAPVLQVHDLARGASVSYGRRFTAPRDMRVAVVGAGYADAYSRCLSSADAPLGGPAAMLLHGVRARILGRVCMQMTVLDASAIPQARAGDRAWLLGGEGDAAIGPEELAAWWGTIPYEVFCLLGLNRKEYVAES